MSNDITTALPYGAATPVQAQYVGETASAQHVWPCPAIWPRRLWSVRGGIAVVTVLSATLLAWQAHRPPLVSIMQPTVRLITESLVTTGRVRGTTETLVGAPAVGIVATLYVREGQWVTAGERLAVLKHEVTTAHVAQMQAAVHTARAQAAQVTRSPARTEVEAATTHVGQARAYLDQQRAAVTQAEHGVAQAQAQSQQFEAAHDLALRQHKHSITLAARGFIAQTAFDQAHGALRIAAAQAQAQHHALAMTQAAVTAAWASVAAAQADVQLQEARLQMVQAGTRPEEIHVAWQRVEEAEQALQVARQQAADAIITAPLAGMVTAIHAEVGQTVGAQGVLKLVSTPAEIRVNVDENHVADVSVGQAVLLSANTVGDHRAEGTVSAIAASVDATHGTVTVTIAPRASLDWLRFGQTVQVTIITHPAAPRLLVPDTAIIPVGLGSGVLVVAQGQARQKIVVTRPPTEQGVPVLAGLSTHDCVITTPQGLTVGDAVRIHPSICGGQ